MAQITQEKAKPKASDIAKELVQPFWDLGKTSRALFGLNLVFVIEGLAYFGMVGLLALFFNNYIQLDDISAGRMVGVQTAGITIAMLFLGATVDWIGLRKALFAALSLMFTGRIILTLSPTLGTAGLWGSSHYLSLLGISGIILGYGIFQPACYSGVKMLTNSKTSAMGYAMLYSLMNLGGFLPGLISPPVRRATGISGVFLLYSLLTVAGLILVSVIISKGALKRAIEEAKEGETEQVGKKEEKAGQVDPKSMGAGERLKYYLKNFPITDARFMFFIFILIPVQTLFAHNWLTLPQYTSRAFTGFVGNNFEFFVNLNPIMIFVLTPVVAALTAKKNTYNMMIVGTSIMALPTFFLTAGPSMSTLMAYLVFMTIGEAIWQPRFLQWVAQIAPKGMTGIYMGIGQFPWFITKVVTALYSGWFLLRYCPADTPPAEMTTSTLWFWYGMIAIISPIALILARKWMLRGFKS